MVHAGNIDVPKCSLVPGARDSFPKYRYGASDTTFCAASTGSLSNYNALILFDDILTQCDATLTSGRAG